MYGTILVPLDGSKQAEAILPHVENLALHFNSRVILLQVVEPITVLMGPEGTTPTLNLKAIDELKAMAESYIASVRGAFQDKGMNVEGRVVFGPVVGAILEVAEKEQADLIAMASHGRGGLSRVFYGSVAAGVLQRVDRPLLLVRSVRND